jgi:hypothetical protein
VRSVLRKKPIGNAVKAASVVQWKASLLVGIPVLLVITDRVFFLGFGQFAEKLAKEAQKAVALRLRISGVHRIGFVQN